MKIGLSSFLDLQPDELKKQYLLFDKLYLDGLNEFKNAMSGEMQSGATGLGIGLSFAYRSASTNQSLKNYLNNIKPIIETFANDGFVVNIPEENIGQGKGLKLLRNFTGINPFKSDKEFSLSELIKIQHFSTRLKSHMLRSQSQYDIIPLLGKPLSSNSLNNKNTVISAIIKNFPVINSDISWTELSDFKKETNLDHLRLKNYINQLANEDLSRNELEERIEYEIRQLEKRYEYYNVDYKSGKLQAYFIFGAKLLEDLANKKFFNLANRILEFKKTKIQLMDDELNIQNNELSYIIKAKNLNK